MVRGHGKSPAPNNRGRVLFLPDFRHGNPYQQRLAEELAAFGYDVRFPSFDGRRDLAREAFRRDAVDLVHVHWPENYVAGFSRWKLRLRSTVFTVLINAIRRRGTKVVWTVHNLSFHESRHHDLERAVQRDLAALCDGLVVHFNAGEESVRQRFGVDARTPVHVTPLGYDAPTDDRVTPISSDQASDRSFVFCHVGEIRAYKGVPLLLDAFRRTNDSRLRLLIAGRVRVPDLERLLRQAADDDPRIELRLGFLPADEFERCLNRADAFVMGGDDYFTSASALQAASWGRVVVAPPHPHLESFLADSGWLRYQAGEAEDLRRALEAAAERSASTHAAAGADNRRRARELTYSRLAAATAEFYDLLLESPPSGGPNSVRSETPAADNTRCS